MSVLAFLFLFALGTVATLAAASLSPAGARLSAAVTGIACSALALAMLFGKIAALPSQWDRPTPFGAFWNLAADSTSLWMLFLLGAVTAIAAGATNINKMTGVGNFLAALLGCSGAVAGVFLAQDALLYFMFFEAMLVPAWLMLAHWGDTADGCKGDSATANKFFIYSQTGGLLMLLAVITLAALHQRETGVWSFSIDDLAATTVPPERARWLVAALLLAFGIKLPVYPFHGWLVDTYSKAPTPAVILFSGVLSKTGAYGIYRLALPLFPAAFSEWAYTAVLCGTISILYGGYLAYSQQDVRKLAAFTSLSHLGYVWIGLFSGSPLAIRGAVVLMVAHGFSSAGMFLLGDALAERAGTRRLDQMGGLVKTAPWLAGAATAIAMASVGLPGFGNFIGEFLVLAGTYGRYPIAAVFAQLGVLIATLYALGMVHRSLLGPERVKSSQGDLDLREKVLFGGILLALLFLGFSPQPVIAESASSPVAEVLP